MNQLDIRSLLSGITSAPKPLAALDWRDQLKSAASLLRGHMRVVFSARILWIWLALIAFYALMYWINSMEDPHRRFDAEDTYWLLMQLPLATVAIFLNMNLVTAEKDSRTLEVAFTTAGSRYKVWLLKIITLNLFLFTTAIAMNFIVFLAFADVPLFFFGANGFLPGFILGALTLYCSIRYGSSLGAGMMGIFCGILFMFLSGIFNETKYMLFFNPYAEVREVDPGTWAAWTVQNRIGMLVLGCLIIFACLRRMNNRENLLKS